MTYLITFTCYGTHIHGDGSGSVDRTHNLVGSRMVPENPRRASVERKVMHQPPYLLDQTRRDIVLAALAERCSEREWLLLATHIRTNHVHAVVDGEAAPERIMNDLKSYASRCLNRRGIDDPSRKRWARHGSTRWLWKRDDVVAAVRYVAEGQGQPMVVFVAETWG